MALVEGKKEGQIGWLTLNRPEKLNALSSAMLKEFDAVFDDLENDPEIRCIIITGAGRSFSVGYDLSKEDYGIPHGEGSDRVRAYDDWVRLRANIDRWLRVWRCPKPVIAAITGFCMGGATQLAVCCDLTIVGKEVVIGWPKLPAGGGLLAPVSEWLIGPKRAKELAYIAGSTFNGETAVEWGWANRAVELDDVLPTALKIAKQIAHMPPDVMRIKKAALNRVMDLQGFSEMVYMGAEWDAIGHDSDGCAEIVDYLDKHGLKETIKWFNGELELES